MREEHCHIKEQINSFVGEIQSRIAEVRKFHPLYRSHSISTKLLPLWHRYDMHPHFPLVMRKLPECLGLDSDMHLDELEETALEEKALALEAVVLHTV